MGGMGTPAAARAERVWDCVVDDEREEGGTTRPFSLYDDAEEEADACPLADFVKVLRFVTEDARLIPRPADDDVVDAFEMKLSIEALLPRLPLVASFQPCGAPREADAPEVERAAALFLAMEEEVVASGCKTREVHTRCANDRA